MNEFNKFLAERKQRHIGKIEFMDEINKILAESKPRLEQENQEKNTSLMTVQELLNETHWEIEKVYILWRNGKAQISWYQLPRYYKETGWHYLGYLEIGEYDRLTNLAREEKGKPNTTLLESTIQAQQEEIERLKAEIEALKSESTTSEKLEHPNALNKSKAIIKALYELADKPPYKEIIRQADLLGFSVSDDTISNRLK